MRGRRARAVAAVTLLLGAAGCGIRGTSIPVDAGAAPSRASCSVPGDRGSAGDSANAVPVKVFLVCSTQLLPVDRTVRVPGDRLATDRLRVARALLNELQDQPTAPEEEAGFSTEVPDDLEVTGARKGDPEEALRLSRVPDELPSYALAQLVCTYADTAAAAKGGRSVVLGGPAEGSLQRYVCTPGLRARPEAARNAGTPLD
ncbi:hypothetical protein ABZW18_09110 [Streptomyces sp. NPDC004647]|uniref:hypothetical protein n=1 Tax=Streptomyces sp. NPDC004647 TaxID=3154671 RepID=UPI0033B7AD0A